MRKNLLLITILFGSLKLIYGQSEFNFLENDSIKKYNLPFKISNQYIDTLNVDSYVELTPIRLEGLFGSDMGPYSQLNEKIYKKQYILGKFHIKNQLGILIMLDAKPQDVNYWKEVMLILFDSDRKNYSNQKFSESYSVPRFGKIITDGVFLEDESLVVRTGRINNDGSFDEMERLFGKVINERLAFE